MRKILLIFMLITSFETLYGQSSSERSSFHTASSNDFHSIRIDYSYKFDGTRMHIYFGEILIGSYRKMTPTLERALLKEGISFPYIVAPNRASFKLSGKVSFAVGSVSSYPISFTGGSRSNYSSITPSESDREYAREYNKKNFFTEESRFTAAFVNVTDFTASELLQKIQAVEAQIARDEKGFDSAISNGRQSANTFNFEGAEYALSNAKELSQGNSQQQRQINELERLIANKKGEKEAEEKELAKKQEAAKERPSGTGGVTQQAVSQEQKGENTTAKSASERESGEKAESSRGGYQQTPEMKARETEARRRQEDYEREQRQKALNQQKKQEYDNRVRNQRSKNEAAAASSLASSATFLFLIGGFVYDNMGSVSPNLIYDGGNIYFGTDFGFGLNMTTIYFNSINTTMNNNAEYRTDNRTEVAWPTQVTFNVRPKLGAEYPNVGGYVFGSFSPGVALLFNSTELAYSFGTRIYGGFPNFKLMGEWESGERRISANRWIDPEESGRGKSLIDYNDYSVGLRFSWYDNEYAAARKHISIGITKQIINRDIEPDDEWGSFRIQSIYQDADAIENNRGAFGLFAKGQTSYEGYFFEFQKDHHSIFKLKVFPKYPLTGFTNGYPAGSSIADMKNGFYFNITYTRSIDLFF